MRRTVQIHMGIQQRSPPVRRGLPQKRGQDSRPALLMYLFGFCLEVPLQQASKCLAMSGLVAGHLSRRRAGRFASYGETLPPQGFPVFFISHNTTSKSK